VKKFLDWIKKFNISNMAVKFVFVVPTEMIDKWDQSQELGNSGGAAFKRKGHMVSINQYVVSLDL
jgi:hypothetical protein